VPQANMKIFLLIVFTFSFFQSSFSYSVDIGDAKDQVFNLLNIIEERNEILKKKCLLGLMTACQIQNQ
jgi:hypothetical protein